jgi:3-methyladenine DNA glycosylase AlkD
MEVQYKKEVEEAKRVGGKKMYQTLENLNSGKSSRSFIDNMKIWDGGDMQFHFVKSKGEPAWTKFIEEFYTLYRKNIIKNTKYAPLTNTSKLGLTTDLASIFRIAHDHLKDSYFTSESNDKLISLKHFKEVTH